MRVRACVGAGGQGICRGISSACKCGAAAGTGTRTADTSDATHNWRLARERIDDAGDDLKTPFFITGLPRSRTAWLANLFCTDSTVCFHDPREGLNTLLERYPGQRVGVADSTLPLKYGALREAFPEAPWLYVERDPSECMRSFVRFTRDYVKLLQRDLMRFWAMHHVASAAMRKDAGVLFIPFGELHEAAAIGRAWAHLVPEVPLNMARVEVLQNLKVEQRISERIKELPRWSH